MQVTLLQGELPPQLQWVLGPLGALAITLIVAWMGYKGLIWSKRQVDKLADEQRKTFLLTAKAMAEEITKGMEHAMTHAMTKALAKGVPEMYSKMQKANGEQQAEVDRRRKLVRRRKGV